MSMLSRASRVSSDVAPAPSFVNARDSIIAADVALTGGENACEIWEAFAARGLVREVARSGNGISPDYDRFTGCRSRLEGPAALGWWHP